MTKPYPGTVILCVTLQSLNRALTCYDGSEVKLMNFLRQVAIPQSGFDLLGPFEAVAGTTVNGLQSLNRALTCYDPDLAVVLIDTGDVAIPQSGFDLLGHQGKKIMQTLDQKLQSLNRALTCYDVNCPCATTHLHMLQSLNRALTCYDAAACSIAWEAELG